MIEQAQRQSTTQLDVYEGKSGVSVKHSAESEAMLTGIARIVDGSAHAGVQQLGPTVALIGRQRHVMRELGVGWRACLHNPESIVCVYACVCVRRAQPYAVNSAARKVEQIALIDAALEQRLVGQLVDTEIGRIVARQRLFGGPQRPFLWRRTTRV
jgi:hypothetical protein